jgi:hypothetical protein
MIESRTRLYRTCTKHTASCPSTCKAAHTDRRFKIIVDKLTHNIGVGVPKHDDDIVVFVIGPKSREVEDG